MMGVQEPVLAGSVWRQDSLPVNPDLTGSESGLDGWRKQSGLELVDPKLLVLA